MAFKVMKNQKHKNKEKKIGQAVKTRKAKPHAKKEKQI